MKTPRTPKTIEACRILAKEYRLRAEKYSAETSSLFDNAPGSYVTGGSNRSKSLDKRHERATAKSFKLLQLWKQCNQIANHLEAQANWIENIPARELYKSKMKAADQANKLALKNRNISLRAGPVSERIHVYHYPTGWSFADVTREKQGDYLQLAFLSEIQTHVGDFTHTWHRWHWTFKADVTDEEKVYIEKLGMKILSEHAAKFDL